MLWWLLQNTIVAAVLAVGVLLVCRWRRIGPAGRHLLWLVVLVKLVTPPLVSWPWAVPRWDARVGVGCPEFNFPLNTLSQSENSGGKLNSGHPTPSTKTHDNGTVVRSETFVVTLPAKKRGKAGLAETTANVPAEESDPDAQSVRVAEPPHATPPWWRQVSVTFWLLAVWACGSTLYLLLQLVRIRRMSSRLHAAETPPGWLDGEIRRWAEQLRVAPPATYVVSGFSSPFLWACGWVRLIWPAQLAEESHLDAWRGVVVHELAHLKRRDHWVGWLELVAGCVWWWNPLFWFVRSQLRENAELACDAWVVEALPGGRRQYAEALLAVCEHISRPQVSAVAIGVGGARRTLERRLTMILKDRVPFRVSRGLLCAAGVLALLILPGWAQPPEESDSADPTAGTTQPRPDESRPAAGDSSAANPVARTGSDDFTPAVVRAKVAAQKAAAGKAAAEYTTDVARANAAARVRQLERKLQDLQRQLRALRGQTPGAEPFEYNPNTARPMNETIPGADSSRRSSMFGGVSQFSSQFSTRSTARSSQEVVATRTITLQRTTYRLPASRAKALEAFLKLHIKAEVLQIELGRQTVRTPMPGTGPGTGARPFGGGVNPMGYGAGPMGDGEYGPRTVSVITITTTPDVQKAIAGIIALMRKDELPRDKPEADVVPGTTTPRRSDRFGPRSPGGVSPLPSRPGPKSGVGSAPIGPPPKRAPGLPGPGLSDGGAPSPGSISPPAVSPVKRRPE